MKTYYDFLGVPQNATKEQIKSAYRKLSIKFHPDKNNGDFYFETMFKNINEAHEILMDDTKRTNYDYKLKQSKSSYTDEAELRRREEDLRRKQEEILRKEQELNRQRFSQRPETTSSTSTTRANDEFDWSNVVNFFWLLNIGLVLLIFITPNKNDRVLKNMPKVNETDSRPNLSNKTHRLLKVQYHEDTIVNKNVIDAVKEVGGISPPSHISEEKINSVQDIKSTLDSQQIMPKVDSLGEKPKWYQFKKLKEWKKKRKEKK